MRVFSDSDWAGKNNAKRRSRSGFHMLIFGGSIDWKTRLQTSIALSLTEAEYYASCMAAKSGIHLRLILNELQYGKMHNPEDEDKRRR
jgi:hypothetical protein